MWVAPLAALAIAAVPSQALAKSNTHHRTRVRPSHSLALAKLKARDSTGVKPTIVVVNGAWANNDAWSGEIYRLQAQGYTVISPVNPLQSLQGDSEKIADLLSTISGPIVLVGHSDGGMVITNAAYGNPNVKAVVYVDAFAPAEGESALQLDSMFPGSALDGPPTSVFNFVRFPGAASGDAELYVQTSVFEQAFANGLPPAEGAELAATRTRDLQRIDGAIRPAGMADDSELVRARHDRQGDHSTNPAVHGAAG